jgi:plasmid stability protein
MSNLIALIATGGARRMGSITIRNLYDGFKKRVRAARYGRSMEVEARQIPRATLGEAQERLPAPCNLYEAIRRHIDPLGGIELEPLPREPVRDPPAFDR